MEFAPMKLKNVQFGCDSETFLAWLRLRSSPDRQVICPLAVWRSRSLRDRKRLETPGFFAKSETAKHPDLVAVSLPGMAE
jgi:hypothetical protein